MSKAKPICDRTVGDTARRSSAVSSGMLSVIEKLEAEDLAEGRSPEFSVAAFESGAMIRRMRKAAKLTQKQLAEEIGVSQARISELEGGLGPHGPSWDVILRITWACGAGLSFQMPGHGQRICIMEAREFSGQVPG